MGKEEIVEDDAIEDEDTTLSEEDDKEDSVNELKK